MNHTSPNVNGMGAFEGLQSGLLLQQRAVKVAKLMLADLPDEAFALVVSEALRRRPALLVARVMDEVLK